MTKYRTITGFVAVALLAAAATTRSSPNDRVIAPAGVVPLKNLTIDANSLPTENLSVMAPSSEPNRWGKEACQIRSDDRQLEASPIGKSD